MDARYPNGRQVDGGFACAGLVWHWEGAQTSSQISGGDSERCAKATSQTSYLHKKGDMRTPRQQRHDSHNGAVILSGERTLLYSYTCQPDLVANCTYCMDCVWPCSCGLNLIVPVTWSQRGQRGVASACFAERILSVHLQVAHPIVNSKIESRRPIRATTVFALVLPASLHHVYTVG